MRSEKRTNISSNNGLFGRRSLNVIFHISRRIWRLGRNVYEHLKLQQKSFDCCILASDDSNDITNSTQLMALVSVARSLHPAKMFSKVMETLAALELGWKQMERVTTDGDRITDGCKTVTAGRICEKVAHVK